jgi:hypothetical protein
LLIDLFSYSSWIWLQLLNRSPHFPSSWESDCTNLLEIVHCRRETNKFFFNKKIKQSTTCGANGPEMVKMGFCFSSFFFR